MRTFETDCSKVRQKIANKRWERNLRSSRKRKERNYEFTNGYKYNFSRNESVIRAPISLCIYDDKKCNKYLNFIENIRMEAKKERRVVLNFKDTSYVSAAAMLLLLSTVDSLKRKSTSLKLKAHYPRDEKTESIFNQTGFTKVLGRKPSKTRSYDDVSFWQVSTGTDVRPQESEKLFERIGEAIPAQKRMLYKGFIEAIANSVEHAYSHLKSSVQSRLSRWWAFGGIRDNYVILLICDLGEGIPKTLPREIEKNWLDRTLEFAGIDTHNDAELIKAATYLRETATHLEHRGKGLHDMKKTVESTLGSILSIHSNRGNYQYYSTIKGNKLGKLKRYKQSIGGTIIEWSMPIGDTGE